MILHKGLQFFACESVTCVEPVKKVDSSIIDDIVGDSVLRASS